MKQALWILICTVIGHAIYQGGIRAEPNWNAVATQAYWSLHTVVVLWSAGCFKRKKEQADGT